MKSLLLLLFSLSIITIVKAQELRVPVDSATNKISYQGIIKVDGVSKEDLYVRGREWFATAFRSAKDVIQMDDKAAGKIIGKGTASCYFNYLLMPFHYTLHYTVSITVKEGRYRYEITDIQTEDDASKYNQNPQPMPIDALATNPKNRNSKGEYIGGAKRVLTGASKQLIDLEESLKLAMAQKALGVKGKDDF